MKKFHKLRSQKGFTIVELLIVIVVIGILAALVLNAFSGVQAKARDTKRQTDVRAIASQLEAGYNNGSGTPTSSYPSEATSGTNPLTDAFAQTNWPGFDVTAFRPPNQSSNSIVAGTAITAGGAALTTPTLNATTNNNSYIYVPYNGSNTLCTGAVATTTCAHFVIFYWSESNGAVVVKNSLN